MAFALELLIALAGLSLAASTVNGGLGYGYSSLSTPLALLALVNRIINPVYVAVEACMNTVMLGFSGKSNIQATYRRVLPIAVSLLPGVIVGSLLLSSISPSWVKLVVYASLLPFILLQAAGLTRAIKSEAKAGVPLGFGLGLLYSVTTVSGPPIAMFWNNQGLVKSEFKAAIAQVRIAESYITAISYSFLGLYTASSLQLFTWIAPPVIVGIPLGFFVVKYVRVETFSRVCRSFDVWIVGYGQAVVMAALFRAINIGYAIWGLAIVIDFWLLYRFFTGQRAPFSPLERTKEPERLESVPVPAA